VPPQDRGLLARLDALVELAADRHGLALAAGGRRLGGRRPAGPRWPSATRWSCCGPSAKGVGLLRVRGDRLEATSLRHAWAQIDPGLRAGLVYAAWCQQVTFTGLPTCARG
jgi:hypothetical protein